MDKKILLVDDNLTNLSIGKSALGSTYEVYTVPSGEKALLLLSKIIPDIILLDIEMPEMNGYDTLRKIKANPKIPYIPVIFLTAKADEGSELEGLNMGAVDYVVKPFTAPLLLKRIESHLRLQDFNNNLQKMVDEKTAKVVELQDAILQKPGRLTEEEFEIMKTHSAHGREIIERISRQTDESEFLEQASILAYTHHERWDGKGYPNGLRGKEIPIQGRLMAIADVYDALISERPYKKPFTHAEAVNIIVREMDDVEVAIEEVKEQLQENLSNTVGIVAVHSEYIETGVFDEIIKILPFPVVGCTTVSQEIKFFGGGSYLWEKEINRALKYLSLLSEKLTYMLMNDRIIKKAGG